MPTVPININNNILKLSFIIRTSSIYIDDGGDSAVASVGRFNNRRCCDSIRKRRSGAHNNNNNNNRKDRKSKKRRQERITRERWGAANASTALRTG